MMTCPHTLMSIQISFPLTIQMPDGLFKAIPSKFLEILKHVHRFSDSLSFQRWNLIPLPWNILDDVLLTNGMWQK